MTNTPSCSFAGDRDEAIVEYLYGEGAGDARPAFAAHLDRCHVCRAEVEALGGVRQALTQWAPPEPRRAFETAARRVGPRRAAPPPVTTVPWRGLRSMPGWAQAAAAVLCVGVAAGAANLRVTYGDNGLSVRTGWLRSDAPATVRTTDQTASSSLRAELTAIREEIRAQIKEDMRAEIKQAALTAASVSEPADGGTAVNDALLRQIRTLISQSEQRQQREQRRRKRVQGRRQREQRRLVVHLIHHLMMFAYFVINLFL